MIMNPTAIKHVVVDGHSLTLESFVAIARYNATVELAPSALEAMQKSRALAEKIAAEGRVAYGITTGFGEFQKVAVPKEMSNQLSTNLILSHCTAAGEPYADEIVRGMMLLRANALCGGVSGVRDASRDAQQGRYPRRSPEGLPRLLRRPRASRSHDAAHARQGRGHV